MDSALEDLRRHADAWIRVSVEQRIELIDGMMRRGHAVARRQVEAAIEAKGLIAGTPQEAEEWLGGPVCQLRVMRLLRQSLIQIRDHGAVVIPPGRIRTRPDGQVKVEVFPVSLLDRILHTGFRAEIWMEPDVTPENLPEHVASAYRDPGRGGKVSLVLGAGNVSSIGVLDAFHKLFTENQVVLFKLNPINEYLGPFIEEVYGELIDAGFVRMAYGGADVGEYLCAHAAVDEIHITGSGITHDRIVFGAGEEGAARKARNEPRLQKRITSELGNVSPVIIVPGRWSRDHLQYHAENIATQMTQNGAFNCNATKLLILHEDWPQRDAFLGALRRTLRALPPRPAYYPGAEDRFEQFIGAHPRAEHLGERAPGVVPPTLLPDLDPSRADTLAFTTESFCAVTGQTALPGRDADAFLSNAVQFCNQTLFGTLNAGIIIHPAVAAGLGGGLEDHIASLRYGSVAVNHWPAISFALGVTSWGAYPGHRLDDIQSGIGSVHNTMLFDRPQRSVVTGPFRMRPKPPWFSTHRRGHHVAALLAGLELDPGPRHLPRIFFHALRP